MPSCDCIPPDEDGGQWIRECDYHREIRVERDFLERVWANAGLLSAQKECSDTITQLENRLLALERTIGGNSHPPCADERWARDRLLARMTDILETIINNERGYNFPRGKYSVYISTELMKDAVVAVTKAKDMRDVHEQHGD